MHREKWGIVRKARPPNDNSRPCNNNAWITKTLTSTGATGGPKQITHSVSSSPPSTLSLPFSRTALANRCRVASSALAATAAMHAALCFFQWPRWQVLLQ